MSPAAYRGKILEPIIFNLFAKDYPSLSIEKAPYIFYSKLHPFMSANIDGLINGTASINGKEISGTGILEIKTSKTGYGFGDDEVPDTYYAQVQHYLSVLDLQWAVISAYMLDREEIVNYVILRDEVFIPKLITVETKFWEENYIPNIIPAAIGLSCEDSMITGTYNGSASTLVLTDEKKELCGQISELKTQIKCLEEKEEAAKINLKTKLCTRAKPSEKERKLSAIGGAFNVTWSFVESRRLDTDAIKKAGLYDQYSKVSTSDRLTVSVKKGGGVA
jgi:predicted phage-related endonuclease